MNSRRRFIKQYFLIVPGVLGAALISVSCNQNASAGKEDKAASPVDPCEDFSGISDKDLEARKRLGYVKESPIADSTCNKCNLFLPPQGDKPCGACMLFKGPVYATGYCTYWTAKQG